MHGILSAAHQTSKRKFTPYFAPLAEFIRWRLESSAKGNLIRKLRDQLQYQSDSVLMLNAITEDEI